ncbi:ADP-ribosylglycohydrolase [Mollisia scopiformis]|uniref:ADP-ribosylglycohydrolase n=1 Tax=Mollisia scopiformis TaxID=149040 RepID=A0A194XUL6_MOLSC|nr:ADP-ribosylglycohydrolase [Mollisia scopiformis]KUJ23729.1 ADP-ribosylglycohydrolase [Mollisia scopiformis]
MTASSLPADYLERVYAGVLGKLIGVYIGRPFEGWTHQRIVKQLGHIHHYVHEKFDAPLVVTDDDVSGTFVFVRALEEHGLDLSSKDIGKTWLNNIIEKKSILWWGGNGVSTEHTAFLNLKHGIKAPASGSIKTNGKAIAEQIGAQIFIDGWAMVAPGNPSLAAKLAEAAGSVSHDGDSVHAAKLWAAMEAEAFVSKDVDHLLDVGLKYVPAGSLLTKLVADIRGWVKTDQDWEKTRQRIEDSYGYDKFPGVCHIIPNHGIMIMALLYAGHDFHSAMHVINTCGWDTDCNSGNIGCLVAIMNGLSTFENGPDWRGPLADRALISSADGGYSINDAARITFDLVNTGRKIAGEQPLPAPKDGAQFHFSLPGSVQGFVATRYELSPNRVKIEQVTDDQNRSGLAIHLNGWTNPAEPVEVLTQVFTPPEIVKMKTYDLMASPLISPGQTVTAVLSADTSNSESVSVNLRLKHYNPADTLSIFDGPSTTLSPGQQQTLTWKIPDSFDSQPIQKVGLALSCPIGHLTGTVRLYSLSYSGSPHMTLKRPAGAQYDPFQPNGADKPCSFWRRVWIDSLSTFHTKFFTSSFFLAQDRGEGNLITGTRDWIDYTVSVPSFKINLGSAGLCVRVQGLNRYYALVFGSGRKTVALVKARDESRIELTNASYEWELDTAYHVTVRVEGSKIVGSIAGKKVLEADDSEYTGGGIGAVIVDGSLAIDQFDIAPV